MLYGNKPFSDAIYKKFETVFTVILNETFSYTDLNWVTESPNQETSAPDNSNELFTSMKKLLLLKSKETDNQKKIINAQQLLNNNLQKEIEILRPSGNLALSFILYGDTIFVSTYFRTVHSNSYKKKSCRNRIFLLAK